MIPNHNYLIITAIGANQPDILGEFTRSCLQCGCNLLNSKINVYGQHITLMLHLAGNWSAIAKIEALLPNLEQRLGLSIQSRRTHESELVGKSMAYCIQIVSMDKPGILNDITNFVQLSGVQIEEISAHTYFTNTNTLMASISLKINVPEGVHLATLREKFMSYCDNNNLDAYLEPLRSPQMQAL